MGEQVRDRQDGVERVQQDLEHIRKSYIETRRAETLQQGRMTDVPSPEGYPRDVVHAVPPLSSWTPCWRAGRLFGRSASFPRGVPRLATQAAQLDAAVQRRFRSLAAVSEFSGDRGLRRHPHVFNFPLYRPVRAFLPTLRKFSRCHFSSAAWRVLLTGVPMRIQD